MVTPTDHMTKTRTALVPSCVTSRRQRKSPDKTSIPKTRDGTDSNPAYHLVKPVPVVSRNSPKHSLYSNSTYSVDEKKYLSKDRFPERSRRRSRKVDLTYKPPTNCSHRVSLPALHRCSNFLTGSDEIADQRLLPSVPRPHRANSWMRANRNTPQLAPMCYDVSENRNKRKVEFRPDSPQVIGEEVPFQSGLIRKDQSPECKPSPRTAIKSILKKKRNDIREHRSRHPEEGTDSFRLPDIDRTNYRSAGRLRNSGTRWRGRTRTSPGISFTCSKEFAKVFENLEQEGELPDIHRKESNL